MRTGIRHRAKRVLRRIVGARKRAREVKAVVDPPIARTTGPKQQLPAGADVYSGLAAQSLSLAGLREGAVPPAVSLVLPPIAPDKIFAGVATALEVGRQLANSLGRPLRVVPLGDAAVRPLELSITEMLARTGIVPPLTVVPELQLPDVRVCAADVWIVTYWTTAHAAEVATRLGVLDPARVIYLIQDYEPGFHPWSVPYALTRATYHAGFTHLVNSKSLANFLAEREGPGTDHGLVFAPHLDLDLLEQAADLRVPDPAVRIFFYGRPGKPRNLFSLGVSALRAAGQELDRLGVEWTALSAGEPHPDIRLAGGGTVPALGTLSRADYFKLLARVDVGLTLMLSPHPSHPPLEVAVSGGLSVTNDLDGVRTRFHERVTAVPAEVEQLAAAVVTAVARVRTEGTSQFNPPQPGQLGEPLEEVVARLANRLS